MVVRIGSKTPRKRRIFMREWRIHANLTQEQLADRMEVSKATISRYEALTRDPPLSFLEAVAEALNCEPADILSRPPDQPSADQLLQHLNQDQKQEVIDFMEFVSRKNGTTG